MLFPEDQAPVQAQNNTRLMNTRLMKMAATPVQLLPRLLQMVSMALLDLPHYIILQVRIIIIVNTVKPLLTTTSTEWPPLCNGQDFPSLPCADYY